MVPSRTGLVRTLRRRLTSPAAAEVLLGTSAPRGSSLEVIAGTIRALDRPGDRPAVLDRSVALLRVTLECVQRNRRDVDAICALLGHWLSNYPGPLGSGFLAVVEFYLSVL